jgi:hypothetical protein
MTRRPVERSSRQIIQPLKFSPVTAPRKINPTTKVALYVELIAKPGK